MSLNERGYRESALKNTLLQDKERIIDGIQKCSIHRLDNTKPEVKLEGETRKSTRQLRKEKEYDINLYFPVGTPVEEIMERTLIDMILETEEKIFVGGLGSVKVSVANLFLCQFYLDYDLMLTFNFYLIRSRIETVGERQ